MSFGIKDAIDILVVATLMFYTYRMMKESGTINIFYGVLAFIVAWVLMSEILDMRLIGTIMDMFVNIGLIIIVILFQDQIKRFLVEIGSHKRWQWINGLFKRDTGTETQEKKWILSVVYACMNMAKSKGERIASAGCILPVSHDTNLPRNLGLRHRSALGIAQATDAVAIVVSEETGNISMAYRGKLFQKLSNTSLENRLNEICQ